MPSGWAPVGLENAFTECFTCFTLVVRLIQVEVKPSGLVRKLPLFICGPNKRVMFSAMEKLLSSKLKMEHKYFKSFLTFVNTNVGEGKHLKIYQMKSTRLAKFEALLLVNDCCEESYSFPLNFQR